MSNRLLKTYVGDQYMVSTNYRKSSVAIESPPWYYETIVWRVDDCNCGDMLVQEDSGSFRDAPPERVTQ